VSWVKLDDQYPNHPKVVQVGPLGMALHVAATCYAAQYLTDGFVPVAQMSKLINLEGISVCNAVSNGVSHSVTYKEITDELTMVGLLEVVPGGFKVHDYLMYNPPADKVKAERAENAARQAAWRGAHPEKKADNAVTNGVTNGHVTGFPSPSPSPSPNIVTPEVKVKKERAASRSRDLNLDAPAVVAYRDLTHLTPNSVQREDIVACVKDLDHWTRIVREWLSAGWKPGNVAGMLERYRTADGSNGSKPKRTRQQEYDADGNLVWTEVKT
jgi:hypothetical protein